VSKRRSALGAILPPIIAGTVTQSLADYLSVTWGAGMFKHSVPRFLGCYVGSPSSGARLRRGPARTSRISSFRRPVWMVFLIHRAPQSEGIESHVVDAASILGPRAKPTSCVLAALFHSGYGQSQT
jgi:hypothetical protein